MVREKWLKWVIFCFVGVVVLSSVSYVLLRSVGIIDPSACISKELQTIPDLSGARVEVVYMNCDTLAKDEAISIYFSSATAKDEPWFLGWLNRRSLILRYDPTRPDYPMPSITQQAKDTILISVPEVSSVTHQDRTWRNISIEYAIGGWRNL